MWLSILVCWIPELGLLTPTDTTRLINEALEKLLCRELFSCYRLYSCIIFPISKVGNSICQDSAELRKPKRAKVHVMCSFRDFLGLVASFRVATLGVISVFQEAATCTLNEETKWGSSFFPTSCALLHSWLLVIVPSWAYWVRTITTAQTIGSLESQKERRKWTGLKEYLKNIMAKDHLNLGKDINLKAQEAEQTLNRINSDTRAKTHHSQPENC